MPILSKNMMCITKKYKKLQTFKDDPDMIWTHDPLHVWSLTNKALLKEFPTMVKALKDICKKFKVSDKRYFMSLFSPC